MDSEVDLPSAIVGKRLFSEPKKCVHMYGEMYLGLFFFIRGNPTEATPSRQLKG
jgi:hypothetical protein